MRFCVCEFCSRLGAAFHGVEPKCGLVALGLLVLAALFDRCVPPDLTAGPVKSGIELNTGANQLRLQRVRAPFGALWNAHHLRHRELSSAKI